MYALDFEYDGQCLSDYGFIICDFNSTSGANVISAGSKITLNTVSRNKGRKRSITSVQYDGYIQTVFDICKNPDIHGTDLIITNEEFRDLMRWLNRKRFLRFQFLREGFFEYDACFYNATFNIEKIEINCMLCGLRLTMETDMPYGYGVDRYDRLTYGNNSIYVYGDEIGYIYPNMSIICNGNGDLIVSNNTYGGSMVIKNCRYGEVITIDGETRIIQSSLSSHAIYNDFNYDFFKLGNDFNNRINSISVNMPCTIDITYKPVIKDAP